MNLSAGDKALGAIGRFLGDVSFDRADLGFRGEHDPAHLLLRRCLNQSFLITCPVYDH